MPETLSGSSQNQDFQGTGKMQMHSVVTEYRNHERKWLKASEVRGIKPEDFKAPNGHTCKACQALTFCLCGSLVTLIRITKKLHLLFIANIVGYKKLLSEGEYVLKQMHVPAAQMHSDLRYYIPAYRCAYHFPISNATCIYST